MDNIICCLLIDFNSIVNEIFEWVCYWFKVLCDVIGVNCVGDGICFYFVVVYGCIKNWIFVI